MKKKELVRLECIPATARVSNYKHARGLLFSVKIVVDLATTFYHNPFMLSKIIFTNIFIKITHHVISSLQN